MSRSCTVVLAIVLLGCAAPAAAAPQARAPEPETAPGEALYRAACVTCHGPDGKGSPRTLVGFDVALPDFTDCSFASAEADADWFAVIHEGGPIRGLDRRMPAFARLASSPPDAQPGGRGRRARFQVPLRLFGCKNAGC